MKFITRNKDKGQVLVLVALALFVLVGFTALAVDGGNIYAERRKMQNAADAGALAGAHQLCFGADTSFPVVEAIAQEYAITHNLAEEADVTVTNLFTVTVVARTTADTFFAGAIGFQEIAVAATASARCTQSVVGGDIFPLAAHVTGYDELECPLNEADPTYGEYFYAFVSDNYGNTMFCDDEIEPGDEIPPGYEVCDCDYPFVGPDGTTTVTGHLNEGERGWLSLFMPEPPWAPDDNYHPDCGANDLRYWIVNSHPGPVVRNMCLPGKSGLSSSARTSVNSIIGEIRNIVLYDYGCDACNPYYNCCSNANSAENFYHVIDFGCLEIVGWQRHVRFPSLFGGMCKQVDVVVMQKRCGEACETTPGGGTEDPDPDAVRSVVLVE